MPTFKNEVTGKNQTAIVGVSRRHHGVAGESKADGAGVLGASATGDGVSGYSKKGSGVVGQGDAEAGVRGLSKAGRGVEGMSEKGDALVGISNSGNGVVSTSLTGVGVAARSESASAVRAVSTSGRGVEGWSQSAYGVSGDSKTSAGVRGTSSEGRGVEGWSTRSDGVLGISETGAGVSGVAGRSRLSRGKDGLSADPFRVGVAAKQWVEAGMLAEVEVDPAAPRPHEIATTVAGGSDRVNVVVDLAVAEVDFDDAAGVGVAGEHRGAGVGVKGVSKSGVGVAAYSTDFEAVHAETHSAGTAAIAAYNLNPRGGGAAVFARKEGTLGHAGFFDGNVWVSKELAVGGDIVLANADCAEDFDVVSLERAEPGSVMVLGDDGALVPCGQAYDKRAVGVISGAGQYKPGLILDKQPTNRSRSPVALLGKVCSKVTAEFGAIEVGDLLTTSPVTGHAMKVGDPARAFGAVIGKALRSWRQGTGLVPMLIALQ